MSRWGISSVVAARLFTIAQAVLSARSARSLHGAGGMLIRRLHVLAGSVVALVTSVGVSAAADEGIGAHTTPGSAVSVFGNQGQIAISSEAGATFSHTTVSGSDTSRTSIELRPGVDYFLIKRLSLGAFIGVDHQATQAGSSTTWGLGPRVGYDIAFSDHFSVWPRVGFSYNKTTVKTDSQDVGAVRIPSTSDSSSALALNVFVPFLFHTNHYFAGVGPALDTDLTGDSKATTIALRVTLGGWVF